MQRYSTDNIDRRLIDSSNTPRIIDGKIYRFFPKIKAECDQCDALHQKMGTCLLCGGYCLLHNGVWKMGTEEDNV